MQLDNIYFFDRGEAEMNNLFFLTTIFKGMNNMEEEIKITIVVLLFILSLILGIVFTNMAYDKAMVDAGMEYVPAIEGHWKKVTE